MKARAISRCFAVWLLILAAIPAHAQAVPGLDAVRVASGLTQPVFVTAPPGDYSRLFIVQQNGQIRILNLATGALNATPFLTVSDLATGGEQGLLGLAFDPNYAANGKFYVYYVANIGFGEIRLVQYGVSANPDIADTTAGNIKTLLTFSHPQTNHNAGWIGFSPRAGDENNLYLASGDGGGANDQGTGHFEPNGNAQYTGNLLGKMLRIQINAAAGTYSIPANNPFASPTPAPSPAPRREIWTMGLRNPYRASFDRKTGRMFIGDVGQGAREEIDVQQPTNPGGGENYGWRLREGDIATPSGSPVVGGSPPPGNVEPILAYPRSGATIAGRTVVGGYVYRGKQIPALDGIYVFADYLGPTGGPAKIFTLNYDGSVASNAQDITAQLFPTATGNFGLANPSSFGEDANGELYITDIGNGSVYKIVSAVPHVKIDSITKLPDGRTLIEGTGLPFKTHTIQATADLNQPYVTVGTAIAGGDGSFEFEDVEGASFSARFYRAAYP